MAREICDRRREGRAPGRTALLYISRETSAGPAGFYQNFSPGPVISEDQTKKWGIF